MLRQALKILDQNKEIPGYKRHHFRASELGQCSRRIAYSMLGYPSVGSASKGFMLQEYTKEHNTITGTISSIEGLTITSKNARFMIEEAGVTIKGEIDSIVKNDKDDRYPKELVTEYKTMEHGKWVALKKLAQVPYNYLVQENTYLHFMIHYAHAKEDIKSGGWLIVKSRLVSLSEEEGCWEYIRMPLYRQFKEFFLEYDADMWRETTEKCRQILSFVDKGKLPDQEFVDKPHACIICPFREQCVGNKFAFMLSQKGKRDTKIIPDPQVINNFVSLGVIPLIEVDKEEHDIVEDMHGFLGEQDSEEK